MSLEARRGKTQGSSLKHLDGSVKKWKLKPSLLLQVLETSHSQLRDGLSSKSWLVWKLRSLTCSASHTVSSRESWCEGVNGYLRLGYYPHFWTLACTVRTQTFVFHFLYEEVGYSESPQGPNTSQIVCLMNTWWIKHEHFLMLLDFLQ